MNKITLLVLFSCLIISCEIIKDENKLEISENSTIVCLGNSLTKGYGANVAESYPAVLQDKISIPVINSGVIGDTSDDALHRIENDVLAHSPVIIIIELGANDFFEGSFWGDFNIDEVQSNFKSILDAVTSDNRIIYLVKFYNSEVAETLSKNSLTAFDDFESMYKNLKQEYNIRIIDTYWDGVWGIENQMFDEIHPNSSGYRIVADNIYTAIMPVLKSNDLLN